MALNKPTSKQLKGHFDALRATKSHALGETIDIAAGNYGQSKFFAGATEVSDPSWIGATDTFFVYLDLDNNLVLSETAGFPKFAAKIAQVVLDSGSIVSIIDERASINGADDGYLVYFDESQTSIVAGDNVQYALESIDGYLVNLEPRLGTTLTKFKDIGLLSGAMNCAAKVTHTNWAQAIEMTKDTVTSRVSYNISIPEDYVVGTDIIIKLFWSTPSFEPGNVEWKINYRVLQSSVGLLNSLGTDVTYIQPAPGVDNRLTDTGSNIVIDAADIGTNKNLLIIRIDREGTVSDTFDGSVRLHLARIEYTGKGIK